MKEKHSEHVKRWRKATKQRIVESMGGCCQVCGYCKCIECLDIHHLNPEEKEFGFGSIRSNPRRWTEIATELRKCVLLCRNCHGEFHQGLIEIPENVARFNEEYADYLAKQREELWNNCPVCGEKKRTRQLYCSLSCAGVGGGKVDWKNIDLLELLKTKTKCEVAEELGISEAAVRKRLKKICGISLTGRTLP